MANVIKHKRGSGSDPSAGNLVIGELAIRTDTGKLFTKMDSGALAEIAGGGSDIAINTLSSSSGTGGGSATFNGSAYRFTLSAPPSVSAAQLLVSINGVIQKPVTGTGQPSEGFAVDGTDIILGDAPETGADFFILTFKSLGVSVPADDSVTSAKIVDGAIVNADVNASAAIAGTKISPDFGSQNIVTTGKVGINETALSSFNSIADDLIISQASGSAGITIRSGTGNTGVLAFTDGANTNFRGDLRYDHNGDYMRFSTDGDERMRIDSSGVLSIGTTTPNNSASKLQVEDSGENNVYFVGNTSTSGARLILQNKNTTANSFTGILGADAGGQTTSQILFYNADNANNEGYMTFETRPSGGLPGEAMRINSSGNIGIGTSSPVKKLHIADAGDVGIALQTTNANTNKEMWEITCGGNASNEAELVFQSRTDAGSGGIEAMRLSSSGRVGVGTSNPDRTIHCHNSSNTTNVRAKFSNGTTGEGASDGFEIGINGSDPAQAVLVNYEASPMAFFTNAAERMRLDSSGRLGIGETSPDEILHLKAANPVLEIEGTAGSSGDTGVFLNANGNHWFLRADNYGSQNGFSIKSGTPSSSTHRLLIDSSGNVGINDTSPTAELSVAATAPHIDIGAAGGTRMKIGYEGNNCFFGATSDTGMFIFKQDVDAEGHPQASGTERMRLTSDGSLLVGCTATPSASVAGTAFISESSGRRTGFMSSSSTSEMFLFQFFNPNGGVGSIRTNGSATSFVTSSDYRLKENATAMSDGITRLKTLKPYRFNFKADADTTLDGFFAHEVQLVVPEAISGTKDEVDSDNNPVYQGIDQSKLVPLLVAALQEAIGRIEALEAK